MQIKFTQRILATTTPILVGADQVYTAYITTTPILVGADQVYTAYITTTPILVGADQVYTAYITATKVKKLPGPGHTFSNLAIFQ